MFAISVLQSVVTSPFLLPLTIGIQAPRESDNASNPESTPAVTISRKFLAESNDEAKAKVSLPFESPDRNRWRRDPSPRPGVALKEMTEKQRQTVDQLLATVLSETGMNTVGGIQKEQDLIAREEEGLGSGYYWFAVYGAPGDGRWAWRLGGHHVSLHVTYDGPNLLSVTPLHLGGQIRDDPADGWAGYASLRKRERLAREIAQSASTEQMTKMRIDAKAPQDMVWSEPDSRPLDEPLQGIKLEDLSPAQRQKVGELVEEYFSVLQPSLAKPLAKMLIMPMVTEPQTTSRRARFGWSGGLEPDVPHYYVLRAPGFLIEYVNSGAHMHTILRTQSDFGGPAVTP